jgi:hypothetical protein
MTTNVEKYTCEMGFITTSDCGNQNQLGSTGLSWALQALAGRPVPHAHIEPILKACRVKPGLYKRSVGDAPQSADDFYGLVAGLYLNNCWYETYKILTYGRETLWIYNSAFPGHFTFRAWFGRFPGLIAHITFGAAKRPNAFLRFAWAASVIWATWQKPKNQDAYIQAWCMVQTYLRSEYRDPKCDLATSLFQKRIKLIGGLSSVLADYMQNPDHPLVEVAKEVEARG